MKPLSLIAALVIAAAAVQRRRRLTRRTLALAGLASAACAVNGSGLIHLPNLAHAAADLGPTLGIFTYPVVALFAFLETGAGIGLIAPGELVVVLGGVAAGQGAIEIVPLVLIVWASAVLGDYTSFKLGRRHGRAFMITHGAKLGLTEPRIVHVERFYENHGGKTLLLGRFIGVIRAISPFVAGTSGMRLSRFLPLTILAAGIWSAICCVVGYIFWQSIDQALTFAQEGTLALLAVGVGSVTLVYTVRLATNSKRRARLREQLGQLSGHDRRAHEKRAAVSSPQGRTDTSSTQAPTDPQIAAGR